MVDQSGNIIAFDYGTRRIGVAVGHSTIGQGRGIGIVQVRNGEPDYQEIENIVQQWHPVRFVVGMPDGRGAAADSIKKYIHQFAHQLTERFAMPVSYIDETLSTEEANYRMNLHDHPVRKSNKTNQRNKVSAGIILESYFLQVNRDGHQNTANDHTH